MTLGIDLSRIHPGFPDSVRDSQTVFRAIMDAVARPGLAVALNKAPEAPAPLARATGAIALTLLDFETPVWLDANVLAGEAAAWLRFHCGCPLTSETHEAAFAFITRPEDGPPLSAFNAGDAKYPDRSTTVVIQVPDLDGGRPVRLKGPGIKGDRTIAPQGLPGDFWEQVADNNSTFQFGVDVILASGDLLMGLPRSLHIQPEGA